MTRDLRGYISLLLLLSACTAGAEDFRLRDGTVFRQARVVEVRPDSLILMHEGGMAMTDLAKLPKAIQARYNYDPEKAAAHRARETASRQAAAEDAHRLLSARDERRMELSRAQFESTQGAPNSGDDIGEVSLSYRASAGDRAYAAAISRIGGEIAQAEESRRAAASVPTTFWTADFWQHPVLRFLGMVMGGAGPGSGSGSGSEPRGWR